MDAPGTGYEVTSPEGERLLYLPPGRRARRARREGRGRRTTWSSPMWSGGPTRSPGCAPPGRSARPPTSSPSTSTTTCRRRPGAGPAARGRGRAGRARRDDADRRRVPRGAGCAPPHPGHRRRPLGQVAGGRAAAGDLPRGAVRGDRRQPGRRPGVGGPGRAAPRAPPGVLAYRRDLRSRTAARRGRAAAADRLPVAVADRRDGPGGRLGRRDVGGRAARTRCASGSPSWSRPYAQTRAHRRRGDQRGRLAASSPPPRRAAASATNWAVSTPRSPPSASTSCWSSPARPLRAAGEADAAPAPAGTRRTPPLPVLFGE